MSEMYQFSSAEHSIDLSGLISDEEKFMSGLPSFSYNSVRPSKFKIREPTFDIDTNQMEIDKPYFLDDDLILVKTDDDKVFLLEYE